MPRIQTKSVGGGAETLNELGDFTRGSDAVSSGNYTTLMPNIGDIYYRTGQATPELYIRQSDTIVHRLDINEWSSSGFDFTPVAYDPNATDIRFDADTSGTAQTYPDCIIGQSVTVYARCTYDFDSSSNTAGGPPRAQIWGANSGGGYKDFTSASDYKNTVSFTVMKNTVGNIGAGWTSGSSSNFTHDDGGWAGAQVVDDNAGNGYIKFGQYNIWGGTNDSAIPNAADLTTNADAGNKSLQMSIASSNDFKTGNADYKQISYGSNCRVFFAIMDGLGTLSQYKISSNTSFSGAEFQPFAGVVTGVSFNNGYIAKNYDVYYTNALYPASTRYFRVE